MKTTQMKKALLLILCMVLIVAMALFTTGCSNNEEPADDSAETPTVSDTAETGEETPDEAETPDESKEPVVDGAVVGEGETTFPLTITDKEGTSIKIEVKTDKTTVGDALIELDLMDGEDSDFGMYVKSVNGITADYNTDGVYWAFYIDGEYATTGIDVTEITEGTAYELRVE